MQKIKLTLLASIVLTISFSITYAQNTSWQKKVSPELLGTLQAGKTADFVVVMAENARLDGAAALPTKIEKARFVYQQLEAIASKTQSNALKILRNNSAASNSLRLVNAIAVTGGNEDLAQQLAQLPEVAWLGVDPWIQMQSPVEMIPESVTERAQVEWGLVKINAVDVWGLGYTGQGVTVGGADTGYDWGHPAIQKKYRGWNDGTAAEHNYNWHDAIHEFSPLNYDTAGNPGVNPCGLNSSVPCDDNNHGTHTMGTITGNDEMGNTIGVAPGARWVGCRNMERGWGKPSSYIECFEWFLAPTDQDGLNPDPARAPHVINNSWYCGYEEGCTDSVINDLLRIAVANLKASGVVVVISNGNSGPNCGSTGNPPAYFEESFSVGATKEDNFIAQFSSRGPVLVDGSFRMKPNVSAPGQGVRSCVRGGNYAYFSGTSMAGPHVVGLVALILSARPELAGHVADIETIVEQTAVYYGDTTDCIGSMGSARPNHAYGWGRVDALQAVLTAKTWPIVLSTGNPSQPEVLVSPNPASNRVVFGLSAFEGNVDVWVHNAQGQAMAHQRIRANKTDFIQLDLQLWPAGIYWYNCQGENGTVSGKFIKN